MPVLLLGLVLHAAPVLAAEPTDPYLWLEDAHGEKALAWVKAQDEKTEAALEDRSFHHLHDRLLSIHDSSARIPMVHKMGDYYYNFWQDVQHVRGIWRRTTLDEYRKADPKWETVLDLDALDKKEGVDWVWHGSTCLEPAYRHCMISLSRGGSDAHTAREFDLVDMAFVKGGFVVPDAKNSVRWIDADRLWVMTDTGEGSMTTSGYPREVRAWTRGTKLTDAPVLFSVPKDHVAADAWTDHDQGYVRHFVSDAITTSTSRIYVSRNGLFTHIEVPDDATVDVYRQWLFVQLRTDWTVGGKTWKAGSLLSAPFDAYMDGKRDLEPVFVPTPTVSLQVFTETPDAVILDAFDNVRGRVLVARHTKDGWQSKRLPGLPDFGTVVGWSVDPHRSDDLFVTTTDFLTPSTLNLGSTAPDAGPIQRLKALPAQFDARGLEITQHEATSKDGTKIPYFEVARKNLKPDSRHPTLIYGYGGFQVSMSPFYDPSTGAAWLEKGGVYVLANIRGGGEFGPKWHDQAIKQNRHLVYEDFAAVAKDLIARKVTSPAHLGAMGGSNGGLLVGNMLVQYPKLFGAIVCQVPLLDMKRYTHIGAGASWIGEYGDPDDPAQWKYIRTFSPYQLEKADGTYPPVLFLTSTSDDRVTPAHARKMAAKMLDQGKPVRFWEDTEGGHSAGATHEQEATFEALSWSFLWKHLH